MTTPQPRPDSRRARRKQTLVTGAVIVLIFGGILLGLYLSDPERHPPVDDGNVTGAEEISEHFNLPGRQVDPREVWISRGEADISALKQSERDVRRQIDDLKQEINQLRQAPNSAARQPTPPPAAPKPFPALPLPAPPPTRLAPTNPIMDNALEGAAGRTAENLGLPPQARPHQPGILSINLSPATTDLPAPDKAPCNIHNCIPPGAFATAALLSGLDAPTGGQADTNPHPVLLELLDTASLPNRYRSQVKECRIIAAGYGRISDERAYLRLERLSCVLKGGEILDVAIKGYVSGEDGKNGMRGNLISKQGTMIAQALLAGTAGGIGKAVSQTYSNVLTSPAGAVASINPNKTMEYGVANGFGTALEKISDWYLKRADETYPIIEIDAGRVVEVVLTEGVELSTTFPPAQPTNHNKDMLIVAP